MRKSLLVFGMLFLSLFSFAQVSKQQAIGIVLDSVLYRDTININVYMEPLLQTESFYKLSSYDSISSPFGNYWLFFIDDMPEYGWGHDCRYVFVNRNDGTTFVKASQTPPWHYKQNLETISEPIAFSVPTICFPGPYNTNNPLSPVEGKYAVLFTGGEESGNDQTFFWNALSHSYCGLIENGFIEDNIFVLSCNGDTIDNANHPTNRSLDLDQNGTIDILNKECSVNNLQSLFDNLSMIMEEGDLLYVFCTMHGYHVPDSPTSYWLSLWEQEPLYDTIFAAMLSQINCSQFIVNIWSCLSGGIAEKIIAIQNDIPKTVISCTSSNLPALRPDTLNNYLNMDGYNYFINTALRYYHSCSKQNQPWIRDTIIGNLQDSILYDLLHMADTIDINFDNFENNGNGNGIQEINEIINYTNRYNNQFNLTGVKHYNCGFKDDLLSLHGITGKVVSVDTVNGNFHIEDTLSVCAQTLRMEDFAKFYLFDADLIVEDTATLIMGDTTAIIARSGDCRIIVKGSLTIGNGVTFEARNGATLEIIFENDTDLAISNASFINCTLNLPSRDLSFDNCHFNGTPLEMNNTSDLFPTAFVTNCTFMPNGSSIINAVCIKNFAHYKVSGCTINTSGGGDFKNGIAVYISGSNSGWKLIGGNDVSGCLQAGIQLYASSGNITMNNVYGNGNGIKLLNNCNIRSFTGNCGATLEDDTQFIHDNTYNEVYMTGSCIPQRFRHNAIHHIGSTPYVYHDAYLAFGDESELRGSIDVRYNHWGSGFVPTTHLYTNLLEGVYEYSPEWVLGDCRDEWVDAALLLNEADSLNEAGAYSEARLVYKQVVEYYPETVSAETALKSLLSLETQLEGDYLSLKEYYLSNSTIIADETLAHLASSLANKCDEHLGNYVEAIEWYENVLTDPETGFNDSIFAAIDLGELYLKMEAGNEKSFCGKLMQYKIETREAQKNQIERALSLIPRTNITILENSIDEKNEIPTISNLNALISDNDTVLLSWDLPFGYDTIPVSLSWASGDFIPNNQLAYSDGGDISHNFDAEELEPFIGWKVKSITFMKVTDWTHKLCVWKKELGQEMELVYIKTLPDEIPEGENTFELEDPVYIERNSQYWFGLRIIKEEGQHYGYAFCIDNAPSVIGKGDLIKSTYQNSWIDSYYGNFWIKTLIVNENGEDYQSRGIGQPLTGYRVYRDGQLIKEIPYSFVTYYIDTEFTRGFDVEYCVTAVYGDEESEPVCATASITGIAEAESDEAFSVSPNPTTGRFTVEGASVAKVEVYNPTGQLVKTIRNTNEINLKGLPQGMYLLRVTDEKGTVATRRIVVE